MGLKGSGPSLATLAVGAMQVYIAIYYGHRFVRERRATSLALIFICPGWLVVALLINGDLPYWTFDAVAMLAVGVTAFLLYAILKVEHRSKHRNRIT